ncbi:MAG: hypothetical protein DRH90_21160, partial [Deltaproteobacteria bacterium]
KIFGRGVLHFPEIQETENPGLIVGQDIQYQKTVREIKGRIPGVEGFKKTGPDIQLVSELLPAGNRTIAPLAQSLSFAAGEAARAFMRTVQWVCYFHDPVITS